MSDKAQLTDAQSAIYELLRCGYPVTAEPLGLSGEWVARCEYYPHPKISTLKALERKGLIKWELSEYGDRIYSLCDESDSDALLASVDRAIDLASEQMSAKAFRKAAKEFNVGMDRAISKAETIRRKEGDRR